MANYLNNSIYVLIVLIPFFLVTGNFLTDLAVSLSGFLFLIYCLTQKYFDLFKLKIIQIFFLFNIYLIISTFLSSYILFSIESSLFYFRYTFFMLAVIHLLNISKSFEIVFYKILFVTVLLVVLDGVFQYIFGFNTIGIEKPGNRLNGFFNDEWVIGSYVARLLPLIIASIEILFKNNVHKNKIFLFVLVICDILIFFSGERTAFFLAVIFNILCLIYASDLLKTRLIALMLSSLVIFISLTLDENLKYRTITQTLEQFGLMKSDKLNIYSPQYEAHYITAYKMFLDKPIIGHGPNTFRKVCNFDSYATGAYGCSTHPHNYTAQFLSETGIIGFSFYLALMLWLYYLMFKAFLRRHYSNQIRIFNLILIAVVICTLPFAPSGSLYNNWLPVFYYLPLAFLIQKYKKLSIQ